MNGWRRIRDSWAVPGQHHESRSSPCHVQQPKATVQFFFLTLEIEFWKTADEQDWRLSSVYSLHSFIERKEKKLLPQGSADWHKLKISLWGSLSPQRLRTLWQLGIQNKTANWISHHYTPTHYGHTVRTALRRREYIAFHAWRRIKGSTTWVCSGRGDFNHCWGTFCWKSVNCESSSNCLLWSARQSSSSCCHYQLTQICS